MKKSFRPIIISAIALLLCYCMPLTTKITYEVTGTAPTVDITLGNNTGGTEQVSDATVPWSRTYDDFQYWFRYLSAQNNGRTGTVTVTIYQNDALFKTASSSGAYCIATASGGTPN